VETSELVPACGVIQTLRTHYGEAAQATPAEAAEAKIERLTAELRFSEIDGFFPTPSDLAGVLVHKARLGPGDVVLEPSAGKGDLADIVRNVGCEVDCLEVNPRLCEILTLKGHRVIGEDCLTYDYERLYDAIIMNPPFEKGQDREHIRFMYDGLKDGGRLVAVCSLGPLQRGFQADQAFRDWLKEVDAEIDMDHSDAFNTSEAFRRTAVRTCIITITRKGE
jgi:protein-L-isoaspartate O-methyltransferase